MKAWFSDSGRRVEVFIPSRRWLRPLMGRCCQACTPRSWDGFYHAHLSSLGFRSATWVTEEDTRYRGWLVRRVCCVLAVGGWKVLTNTPGDLLERVCRNKRVQELVASKACGGKGESKFQQQCKEKVLGILSGIQAPLCLPMLRLCCWALLRFLSRLFLSVQLHRGQLEMVLKAARTPSVPLVFLSTHKSQLDGLLLSFLLFSQGLGVPRVTVGNLVCSSRLRALLGCLGAVFLPTRVEQALNDQDGELPVAVLASYLEEVLRSRQPLVIFLEEPCAPWHLSGPARSWLALLYRSMRDSAVPDVLLVPVGIAYDCTPDRFCGDGEHSAQPLSLGACLWAACRALCRCFGCARVDLAQPFSLQEFVAKSLMCQSSMGEPLEELLPTILGMPQLDYSRTDDPEHRMTTSSEAEEEMMVTKLGLHALSDAIACSAVTAVGITSALLLHKHRKCVRLSQLMADFAWLLEETLLRQHDVSFSGQLRTLVLHSLALLRAHVTLYHLAPLGDVMVVIKDSAETQWELSRHSAQLVPVFASEAVGACAIRALLLELLPFVGEAPCPSSITFSEDELHHKILALLQLLPPSLLGLKVDAGGTRAADGTWRWLSSSLPPPSPCSPASPSTARARTSWTSSCCAGCWRLKRRASAISAMCPHGDVAGQCIGPTLTSATVTVTVMTTTANAASGSASPETHPASSSSSVTSSALCWRPTCEQWLSWRNTAGPSLVGLPQTSHVTLGHPFCPHISPTQFWGRLKHTCSTCARNSSFLLKLEGAAVLWGGEALRFSPCPNADPALPSEATCAYALQQFLAEKDGLERPMWSLVLSTLQSFKIIGVLKEMPSPSGPLLHLVQPFCSSEGREKLQAFLEQFMQL